MGSNRGGRQDGIGRLLEALPPEFAVTPVGPAWFVVGPPGAHLVLASAGSASVVRALERLAATVRSALAEGMIWVPFVHALLVSSDARSTLQVNVVPPDRLVDILTGGRLALEDETRDHIRALVDSGVLSGMVEAGPAPADARMARCAGSPAPMAST